MSIKQILVLPNYNQKSSLPTLVQSSPNKEWKLSDYKSDIFPNLPKGAGHGIPLAIVTQNNRSDFVLGRIIRQQQPVVFLSCQAGKDKTGRIVFLTLIVSGPITSLHQAETALHIPSDAITPLLNNPDSPVPAEQIPALKAAIATLNKRGDSSSQTALEKMWKNYEDKSRFQYFTSVPFKDASAYPPDSEAACFGGSASQGPLGQKKGVYIAAGAALLLAFLLLRQCGHSSESEGNHQSQSETPSVTSRLAKNG